MDSLGTEGNRVMGARRRITVSTLVAIWLAAASTAAVAAPAVPDPYESARAFWSEHGVSEQVQQSLVEKLNETGTIDAISFAMEPVTVETQQSGTAEVTVATFEDGSIAVTSFENPDPTTEDSIVGRAVHGNCQVTSGSGWATYKNCEVVSDAGVYRIGFKVTYERYATMNAKIISSGSEQAVSGGGSITHPTRSLWRPQSTSNQSAVVKYHSYYTAWTSSYSEDVYLGFWVSRTGTPSTSTS